MEVKGLKKLIAAAIAIGVVGGATGCQLISKTPEGEKKTVVAKVNNENILKGEFQKRWDSTLAQLEAMYGKEALQSAQAQEELKSQKSGLLDSMVMDKIKMQKAKELNVIPDENTLKQETDKKIDEMIKLAGSKDNFKKFLDQVKLTEEDYREMAKTQIIFDKLEESLTKDVTVSDSEIKKYYDENKYAYTTEPNKMHVAHILVNDLALATKIKEEYDKGAKFEDLAKKYGTDGTKDNGGDLGEVPYVDSGFDQDFMNAAIKVPKGQVSQPVKTQFGYHLIKIIDKKEYPVKPFESVKNEIKNKLLEEKKNSIIEQKETEWKNNSKIKKYEDRI